MKFGLQVLATMILGYILAIFFPWWTVAIAAFICGLIFNTSANFSAGFLGIAVALVGRSHPIGICLAALLFATLSQGGLAVNALVPKQMVDVLQAVVILAVATSVSEVRRLLRGARRSAER